MKGKILSLFMALALMAALVLPIPAFATDVGGSFGTLSNTPAVTVTLYNAAGGAEVTSMTPYTAYTVKVNVTDADGKTNLNTVTLKLWYDLSGGTPLDTEFDAAAANVQTGLIITWTQSNDTFTLTGPTSTTWALGSCSSPTSLPGDFAFKFTVGKVATETTSSANWQIAARVLDRDTSPNNIFAYDSDTGTNDMNSYREINVTFSGTKSWGILPAGQAFAEGDPDEENVGNITYISNGAYSKKVSTGSWGIATLDEDGASLAANSFSLKADDDDTLTDAVFVTGAGATTGTGTITDESGSSDANNGLWLQLASTFAGGTFTGTITYTIQ
jgi:hypothetical protein